MASQKQSNLKNILDALVDNDGLKTEVTVTLTQRTLMRTSVYLVGTVIVGTVAFFTLRSLFLGIENPNNSGINH